MTSPLKSPGMTVREATPADMNDVVKLLSARDHRPHDPRIVGQYLWDLDPDHTRAWLAYADGQPVGITMLYLRQLNWPQIEQLQIEPRTLRAGYWAHLYVDPEFRKRMVYPQLVMAMIRGMEPGGIGVIFTATRQPHVAEGHERLGFALVGKMPLRLRPLRPFRLLAKHKGFAGFRPLCAPWDGLYRIATRKSVPSQVAIEPVSLESPQVDRVVELLNGRPVTTVRQIWTPEQFRRRYRTTLDGTHYRVTTVARGSEVAAALVMAIAERGNRIRAGVLLELIARPDATADEVGGLLADAEEFAYKQGADLMLSMSDTLTWDQLAGVGNKYLTSGSETYHLLVYPKTMAQPPCPAADIERWGFEFADHDAF